MQKVLFLKGLPGSGKSTYATELMVKEPGKWKRINKDSLRAMLDNSKWSKTSEKYVVGVRNALIGGALDAGYNVIVDDTNFAPSHLPAVQAIAALYGASVETKFIDTPLDVCIARDRFRRDPVGEKVIQDMYDRYLAPKFEPLAQDELLPHVVICDIDGTLAKMNGRGPFEWSRVGEDVPNWPVINLVKMIEAAGTEVIFFSGRDSSCKEDTHHWLEAHGLSGQRLFMRPAGDNRKDAIIKRELFEGAGPLEFPLDKPIESVLSLCSCDEALSRSQSATLIKSIVREGCAKLATPVGLETDDPKARNYPQLPDLELSAAQINHMSLVDYAPPATNDGLEIRPPQTHRERKINSEVTGFLQKTSNRCTSDKTESVLSALSPANESVLQWIMTTLLEEYGGCSAIHAIADWVCLEIPKRLSTEHTSTCRLPRKDGIRGKYFVEFVIDDRDQVVSMWRRELGLPCFQVDYGNF